VLSIPPGPTTRVLLEEPESRTNDRKKSMGEKKYLDHGSIRVKQKIEGRKKIKKEREL